MDILLQWAGAQNFYLRAKGQVFLPRFDFRRYVLGRCRAYGIVGFFVLSVAMPLIASAKSHATVSFQLEIADELQNVNWEQSRITAVLLDDRQNLSGRILGWREESKALLEPLVKEYMYVAELLTRMAVQKRRAEEREQALVLFYEQERHIQNVLDGYAAQIDRLFQGQALQRWSEEGRAVERIEFHDIPSGKYRVHVVLAFATTTLHWFEALTIKGGDTVLCTLTRENLNNPYWTELNWWKFINLDFSKHH